MSEMIAAAGVPEVNLGMGQAATSVPDVKFSGAWGDFNKDMALIAAEQTPAQPEQAPATVTAEQPQAEPKADTTQAQPAPAPAPTAVQTPEPPKPEIPEKFRAPDGTLDQEKLMKSYAEAERGLKRLQNQAHQAAQPQPVAPSQQPSGNTGPLTPLEAQVAQDIYAGGGFSEQQAISLARVQVRMAEAQHKATQAATFSEVSQFRETLQDQARRTELESLAKSNPWVLTPQGQSELVKVREEQPWINNSPQPWRAATLYLLGQKSLQGAQVPVHIPNPMGAQQTATPQSVPPLPATPAPTRQQTVPLNSQEEIMAHVKTLTPQQEAEFWKRAGMKWDTPKQFNSVI